MVDVIDTFIFHSFSFISLNGLEERRIPVAEKWCEKLARKKITQGRRPYLVISNQEKTKKQKEKILKTGGTRDQRKNCRIFPEVRETISLISSPGLFLFRQCRGLNGFDSSSHPKF